MLSHSQTNLTEFDSISKLIEETEDRDSIIKLLTAQKEITQQSNDLNNQINVLLSLSSTATRGSDLQLTNAKEAYDLSKQIEDSVLIAKTSVKLARILQVQSNYTEAIQYVNISLKYSKTLKNKKLLIEAYSVRANIYNNTGQITDAIQDINTAKVIAYKQADDGKLLIPLLKTESYIQYSNNKYKESIASLNELIDFYIERGDYKTSSLWQNNKALTELNCNCVSVEAQKKNLFLSIKHAQQSKFKAGEAYAYVHLSRVYKNAKQLDSAKYYLDQAKQLKLGYKGIRFKGYLNQTNGDYWVTTNHPVNAIKFYKKAYEIWKQLGVVKDRQYTAKALAANYKKLNKKALAYDYLQDYIALKDSNYSKKDIEQRKEIALTYEFKKQQYRDSIAKAEELQRIAIQNANKLKEEKHIQQLLIGLFGMAIVLGSFAYLAYRRKKKTTAILNEKNKIIEDALYEKQLLLKEVHHRVKNNFQIVSSLLELQTKDIEDEKARNLANEGKNRVKSMALIHQKLYQNDSDLINFDEYLQTLVKELTQIYSSDKNIKTNVSASQMHFDIDTAIPLGLIINELITNAYKYAFNKKDDNILNVSIHKLNDLEYKLTVADNGKGIDETIDLNKVKSLGLRLVKRLTKQLHGRFTLHRTHGTAFEIVFKDTQARALLD